MAKSSHLFILIPRSLNYDDSQCVNLCRLAYIAYVLYEELSPDAGS
jgi:hypothetical protein